VVYGGKVNLIYI